MGSDNYKWHIHCPVCGAFLEKSSQCDSEVDCKKCKSTLEVLVKDIEEGMLLEHLLV